MRTRMFRSNEVVYLSKQEESHFIRLAQVGDPDALDTMIRSVMPYVLKLAKKFNHGMRGMSVEDLFQEAMVTLVEKAVPKFRPETKNRFSTYATAWIMNAFMREARVNSMVVRVPAYWFNRRGSLPPRDEAFLNAVMRGGERTKLIKLALPTIDVPLDLWVAADARSEFVKRLEDRDRELFLAGYAGVPLRQTAELLGLNYQTARSRIRKTKKMALACA